MQHLNRTKEDPRKNEPEILAVPSCRDCVFRPTVIPVPRFYCQTKQHWHIVNEGVCGAFVNDCKTYEQFKDRYPHLE